MAPKSQARCCQIRYQTSVAALSVVVRDENSFEHSSVEVLNMSRDVVSVWFLGKIGLLCKFVRFFCILTVGCSAAQASASIVYDAATDFSLGGNPNGTWSYGYSATLGGPFNTFVSSFSSLFGNANFDGWSPPVLHPFVASNEAATTQQGSGLLLPPGELGLHPGPDADNNFAIVRWTAPESGLYNVSATFVDRDASDIPLPGATTDVHVLLNSISVYDTLINKNGWGLGPTPFAGHLSLAMGDTLDFVVGRGANTFHQDSTGLSATIAPVPEALSLINWLIIALVSFGASHRWRPEAAVGT